MDSPWSPQKEPAVPTPGHQPGPPIWMSALKTTTEPISVVLGHEAVVFVTTAEGDLFTELANGFLAQSLNPETCGLPGYPRSAEAGPPSSCSLCLGSPSEAQHVCLPLA